MLRRCLVDSGLLLRKASRQFKIAASKSPDCLPSVHVTTDGQLFRPAIMSELHTKCRYPNEYLYVNKKDGKTKNIVRHEVPAGLISWDLPFDTYDPIVFNAPHLVTAPYADPDINDPKFKPKWNHLDGKVNRKSHQGPYAVEKGLPLNIRGRTGLKGRGVLGRYGPNHAADPIVTRWKRSDDGQVVEDEVSKRAVLQFVSIQRRDTSEWAIPGGMVDPGENVSEAVLREFLEEALDSTSKGASAAKAMNEKQVRAFFEQSGQEIYKGYVDDPRNTDNAWMETVAFLFHDDTGKQVGQFDLKAGDDAKALQWTDVTNDVQLYASHSHFLRLAAQKLDAHWRKVKPEAK